ncbi:MAG: hypothetical protein HKM02_00700, partial [Pseudomonadales bacterium]|nr:hypothetical protein [Pseudomonadales bacterium]
MRRHLLTGLWRLLLLLTLLLLTLVSVLDVLVNTPAGSRFLLEQVLGSTGRLRVVWRQGALNGALDLDKLDWHARTFDLHLSGVSAQMSWRHGLQGQWWIDDLKIRQAELDFPQHKPAVTLLHRFWSPVELVISRGGVDHITVQRGAKRYEHYQLELLDGHWLGTQVRVAELGLIHPAMHANVHGWIRLQDDYPLSASGYMRWPVLEAAGMTPWRLNLANTLVHMHVQASTVGGSVPVKVQAEVKTTYPHLPYQGWVAWQQVNWPWLSSQQLQSGQGVMRLTGDLQSYRGRADLQLQGRWLPRGEYTFIGQGTFHDLEISQWLYHGLGGEGRGQLNLVFGHHVLDWSVAFEPHHVLLSQQWPLLHLYFPEWSGSWQSQGHATATQSQWSLSGTTPQGEHWQGQGQVAAWVSRLDLPYSMKFMGQHVTRTFPHLGQVRMPQLTFNWQGSWQDHRGVLQADVNTPFWPALHARVEARAHERQWHVQDVQLQSGQGAAEFTGDAFYRSGWSWQGQLQTHALNPAALWPSWPGSLDADAQVQGGWTAAGWNIFLTSFNGSGVLRDRPIHAEFTQGSWHSSGNPRAMLQHGIVDWGTSHLLVEGAWGQQQVEANLSATGLDLADGKAGWHGTVDGEVKISGPVSQPDVQATFVGNQWQVGKVYAQGVHGALLWVQGGQQDSHFLITMDAPRLGGQSLKSLELEAKGTLKAQTIGWKAEGVDSHLQGKAQGVWSAQDQRWSGRVDEASVSLKGMIWAIAQPFDLAYVWPTHALKVNHQCWIHADASLCLQDDLQVGNRVDIHVSLQNLQAADLQPWLPQELRWQGVLHGEGQVLWSSHDVHPAVRVALEAAQGQVFLQQDKGKALVLPYQRLALDASLQAGAMDAQLELDADQLGQARIHAHVDTLQPQHSLSGQVHVSHLAIQPLRVFFPQMQSLSGWLNAEGLLSGSLEQPGFAGYVQVFDGRVQAKQNMFVLSNIQVRADIDGEHAHWTGQFDSGQGQAAVTADSQWTDGVMVTEGNLKGHGLSLQKVPLVESSLDPDLHFKVKPHEVNVQGQIKVQEADIRMRDSGDASLQPSADVQIYRQAGVAEQRHQPWTLIYDIEVLLGDKVNFRGFDADGRLTGQVRVQQDAQGVMSAHGEIDMDPETSFRSYGQNLRLRKGRLIFLGPPTNPQVDVEAVKDFDPNVTVGVHITGWSNQLQSTLISDNQLSQDEISSYLVFGHAPERQQALFGVNNAAIPAGT